MPQKNLHSTINWMDIDVPAIFLGCIHSLLISPRINESEIWFSKILKISPMYLPLDEHKCYDETDPGTSYHLS